MLSKGTSALDLIVVEFWNGCGQMDLASACVLRPLNHLVLDFEVRVSERVEARRCTGPEMAERVGSEGRS